MKVEKIETVIKEIEHENDLYENFEKDMQNTSVLSSNEHDSLSVSEISSKKFSRTKITFNLFSETVKYDSKKTLSKQITDFKSHRHMIKILVILNSDQDVIEFDEFQNLKEVMISFYWFEWQKAIKVENNFLLKNQIWELTQLSSNVYLLTDKWVFRLKKNRTDNVSKFKAQ